MSYAEETCSPDEHLAELGAFFENERATARARLQAEGMPRCQVDQLMQFAEAMHRQQLLDRAEFLRAAVRFVNEEPPGRLH